MAKIPREILKQLLEASEKLPTHKESSYSKNTVLGNDINLKNRHTKLKSIDSNKEYTGTTNVGRNIDATRHFKRLKKAYIKNGQNGVHEYMQLYSKQNTIRKRFTFMEFVKYHLLGIKPFGQLERKKK